MTEASVREELEVLWGLLSRRPTAAYRTAFLPIRFGDRHLGVALDEFGARYVLIPREPRGDARTLWRNGSLTLSCLNLKGEDGVSRSWLALKNKRFDLSDVFSGLAAHLLVRLSLCAFESVEAGALNILDEWRALFGSGSNSKESACGVIGELLLLKTLCALSPTLAWKSWEGPRGGRHDFRHGRRALEVKSTGRSSGRVVSISGITQLQEPENGDLHLVFFRLERALGGPLSVRSLVEEIVSFGVERGELLDLLDDDGSPVLDSAISEVAYELRESATYRVTEGFPRIIPESFLDYEQSTGVGSLKYSVDLDYANALSEGEARAVLTSFISLV